MLFIKQLHQAKEVCFSLMDLVIPDKIFLINLMLAKIRSDEGIALTTASSGIAATLLDGDTTAHSRFKISIDINSDSICNIPAQSHLAELIRETQLVFWDETSMQYRHTFETIDCIFKDIRNDPRSFGGVVFCFCERFSSDTIQLFQEEPADKLYLHVSNVLRSGNMFNICLSSSICAFFHRRCRLKNDCVKTNLRIVFLQ